MERNINTPLTNEVINEIEAGDYCYISGVIYSARDAAHKRMTDEMAKALGIPVDELLSKKEFDNNELETIKKVLPFDIKDQIIYYLGPTPAREGQVIGSAGPTTSTRMDKYTPALLNTGLVGMIGKGRRSPEVIDSMKKNTAVYFAAVGGAGALLSKCIVSSEVIAYDDLGTEAVRKLTVEKLPVIAVIDHNGNNQYDKINR